MQLRPDNLEPHLSKSLHPLYFLYGAEPFLVQNSADAIRSAARQLGFEERLLFILESQAGFDWQALIDAFSSRSLFAEKKIVELIIQVGSINAQGVEFFKQVPNLLNNNPDILLLIRGPELSAAAQKTTWFKTLASYTDGVIIAHPVLTRAQLSQWILKRCREQKLQLAPEALEAMLQKNEGNTLAAHQEITMLDCMYAGNMPNAASFAPIQLVDYEAIMNFSQQARFSVFDLQDALLQGDKLKTIKILSALEPSEGILILWAVTKIIRTLMSTHYQVNKGMGISEALQSRSVWSRAMPLYTIAFKRLSFNSLKKALEQASHIDRDFKSGEANQAWRDLIDVCLALS